MRAAAAAKRSGSGSGAACAAVDNVGLAWPLIGRFLMWSTRHSLR